MSDALFGVEGQVVLLSGASRGIGQAMAAAFAARGAVVVITGREAATLTATAAGIAPDGGTVGTVVCDVAEPESIRSCVAEVLETHGRIDTLVNVAGVNKRQPAESFTPEDYDFIFDINLRGAYLMSIEVGRHMIERRSGCQVNVDSLSSHGALTHITPYAMSKAGMTQMTRGLALEWGRHGVRVNGIAPGFILTDLTAKLWSSETMKAWGDENIPLGRLGRADDLVGAAIYLASPASAYMNGHTLRIDGGISAGLSWPIERA